MGGQIGFMFYILVFTILIGLLNYYFRYAIFIYAFFGLAVGGYINGTITAQTMRYFGATEWRFSANASAFCLPSGIISVIILVDIIEYFEKAN